MRTGECLSLTQGCILLQSGDSTGHAGKKIGITQLRKFVCSFQSIKNPMDRQTGRKR